MTDTIDKARRFRALHDGDELFVMPNPWDLGTLRVLEGLGFPALATTSAGLAYSLGRRDGAVGRDEAIAHAAELAAATDLPVSGDLENGYGDSPEDVAETIRLAAAAGLAGASIEDYTGIAESPIYDPGLARERIVAAVEAAGAAPHLFTLTARAENFLRGRDDLDDTVARLKAFGEAGAHCLYAPGLPGLNAVRRVCAETGKPVNVLADPRFTLAELAAAGVRRVSLGSHFARAALGGFLAAAREVSETGSFRFAGKGPGFSEIEGLMKPRD